MGQMLRILVMQTILLHFSCAGRKILEYDNLNENASVGINCSEVLDKLVTNVEYSVEDFTDYTQDEEEPKYAPDIPKSRKPRGIKRVLSWVGRGFNKVFNSPYIYNFYPLINYSVGKIMQHLPFVGNSPSNPGPPSPDYPQSPSQPNPQQLLQQQKMQQEYEEEMERKQHEMKQKQEEEEAKAKRAAEEKKQINDRAKKLAAKYVELYFAKKAQTSPITTYKEMSQNYAQGAYNLPLQPPAYNNPVYDQAYAQANYPAAYPSVDNLADPVPLPIPPVYNPASADNYENV